jgi:hypothetical protein
MSKVEHEEISNNIFKPLPINQRYIRSESDITTLTNATSVPIQSMTNEQNIPLLYPQFQLGSFPKLTHPINPFIYPHENKKMIDMKIKPCCSCNKTKCIKKYCECFANNKLCINCLCLDCRNKDIFLGLENETEKISKDFVLCTCSKSGCNKKYCECFKEGLKCNVKCRCINCLNCEEPLDRSGIDNTKLVSLEESKSDSDKKVYPDCYNIQRISVIINKNQTLINVEKLDQDEFSLLCKKRKKNSD